MTWGFIPGSLGMFRPAGRVTKASEMARDAMPRAGALPGWPWLGGPECSWALAGAGMPAAPTPAQFPGCSPRESRGSDNTRQRQGPEATAGSPTRRRWRSLPGNSPCAISASAVKSGVSPAPKPPRFSSHLSEHEQLWPRLSICYWQLPHCSFAFFCPSISSR